MLKCLDNTEFYVNNIFYGSLVIKKKRQELSSALKREDKKRYAYRLHIILLLDDGYSQHKISELFFLDPGSINRWLQKYKEGGIDLLIADSYENSTKRSKLFFKEEKALSSHLSKNLYHKVRTLVCI